MIRLDVEMFDRIESLVADGRYEEAYNTAKTHADERLQHKDKEQAALALSHAGHVLCMLNDPTTAASHAQESFKLARRASKTCKGFAQSVLALAQLRLGQWDRSKSSLESAIDLMACLPLMGANNSLAENIPHR